MATAHHERNSGFSKHASELRNKAMELGNDAHDLSSITKKLATDAIGFVGDNASDYYQKGIAQVKKAERGLEQNIKSKPMRSVLIATGIGLVLGALWRLRK
ncbi:MAG: hypothetical protein Q7S68_02940 [Deltaproteobacteria bacterium]|nr:hypothetical protein [Deltaproteobacteria bacterium]